jgi:iron(III) transport system ATP-binding protein
MMSAAQREERVSSMLTVKNLSKAYDAPPRRAAKRKAPVSRVKIARPYAVEDVSFTIEPGEMFTLLGPSGCGKTTTLRSIAGLEAPNRGTIAIGDRVLYDGDERINVSAHDRGLGMVFQSYAIWPHLSVFKNVSFPLEAMRRARPSRAQIRERVYAALEATALDEFAERSATALSGGQQQRLALARALVINPPLLLLDEPLSNLDAKLRESMRFELKRLQREFGLTCVYVTHDQTEALTLSDRIAVMNEGRIVQIGTPSEIYAKPNSHFVADFIGTTNFVDGTVAQRDGDDYLVDAALGRVSVRSEADVAIGAEVQLSVRPEWITLSEGSGAAGSVNVWAGVVVSRAFQGDAVDYMIRVGDLELRSRANPSQSIEPGSEVSISAASDRIVLIEKC